MFSSEYHNALIYLTTHSLTQQYLDILRIKETHKKNPDDIAYHQLVIYQLNWSLHCCGQAASTSEAINKRWLIQLAAREGVCTLCTNCV